MDDRHLTRMTIRCRACGLAKSTSLQHGVNELNVWSYKYENANINAPIHQRHIGRLRLQDVLEVSKLYMRWHVYFVRHSVHWTTKN